MTNYLRAGMSIRLPGLLCLTFLAVSACGGSSGGASGSGPSAGASPSRSSLAVTSSIKDGAHLSKAQAWTALVSAGPLASSVDFSVDGHVLWTEHKQPYSFNDDQGLLAPWLLGAGPHTLSVRATGLDGHTATDSVQVVVAAGGAVPAGLIGDFRRTVTPADLARNGQREGAPSGVWTLHITPNGLMSFDDPVASGANEMFTATANAITVLGPANWLSPQDRRGGFCEPAVVDHYRWARSGSTLTVSQGSNCPDRMSVLVGAWSKA